MSAVPIYSKQPTDWMEINDISIEMRRVAGIEMIAGCMRLWVWLMYSGVRREDGAMVCSWDVAKEVLRVGERQVYRWRRELECVGWLRRGETGVVWVHPKLDMVRVCINVKS